MLDCVQLGQQHGGEVRSLAHDELGVERLSTHESFVLLGFDLIRESLGLGVTRHSELVLSGRGALDAVGSVLLNETLAGLLLQGELLLVR